MPTACTSLKTRAGPSALASQTTAGRTLQCACRTSWQPEAAGGTIALAGPGQGRLLVRLPPGCVLALTGPEQGWPAVRLPACCRFLVVSIGDGCSPTNRLWYLDLERIPRSQQVPLPQRLCRDCASRAGAVSEANELCAEETSRQHAPRG